MLFQSVLDGVAMPVQTAATLGKALAFALRCEPQRHSLVQETVEVPHPRNAPITQGKVVKTISHERTSMAVPCRRAREASRFRSPGSTECAELIVDDRTFLWLRKSPRSRTPFHRSAWMAPRRKLRIGFRISRRTRLRWINSGQVFFCCLKKLEDSVVLPSLQD